MVLPMRYWGASFRSQLEQDLSAGVLGSAADIWESTCGEHRADVVQDYTDSDLSPLSLGPILYCFSFLIHKLEQAL